MSRLWPAPKGRPLSVKMPVGLGLAGIAAGFDAILEAINDRQQTTGFGSLIPLIAAVLAGR
jgi:hypothetical protein